MAPNKYTWFLLGGLIVLALIIKPAYGNVGEIGQISGSGVLERGKDIVIEGNAGVGVQSMDEAVTANGTMRIDFVDETRVELTEQSRLVIDEFVYDPANDVGSLSIKASLGTVRYASGQIAKKYKQNVKIRTPSATIGVRGTDFAMVVDEMGGSMITLLPSCDTAGMCYVGEITVETDAGMVILNQAFQATVVDTVSSSPMKPVLLNIDENLIGNLLIVSKPREIADGEAREQAYNKVASALDIDFLQFDDLEIDYLEEEKDQWVTGLDIDFLEQNFLVDILAQINRELAKAMRSEFDKKSTTGDVRLGKDPETGIIILDEDPQWVYSREGAGNFFELRLDKEYGYVISFRQNDFEVFDFELGGNDNVIKILQNQ